MAVGDIAIIGLGKFGFAFGEALIGHGYTVIGIDSDAKKVRQAKDSFSQVYEADATDKDVLKELDLSGLDYIIVAIGGSMENSILTCMNLKELGAKEVWAKATSKDHEKLLARVGADFVVFPELFVAKQLARKIAEPGFLD